MTGLILLLTLGMPDPALQEQAELAFAEGLRQRENATLARPLFQQAARCYEQMVQQGAQNPLVQQNLGNAWLLADDLPRAILAYRRGLQLDPGNLALRTALEGSRQMVLFANSSDLGRQPPLARPPWLPSVSLRWFILAGLILYGAGCLVLTRWLMLGQGRLLVWSVPLLAAAAGIGYLVWHDGQDREEEVRYPLVVINQDGVLLRKGNNQNFPLRFDTPLNRGVEARQLRQRGQWLQIELAGGETGWIPRGLALVDQ
jgi:tetratricopeptide (TPR) repeat protein